MQEITCAVYREGSTTDQTMSKSGLRCLVLAISYWVMLQGPRTPVEADRHQIETFTENSQSHTTWEIANILKVLLKIICINFVC